MHMQKKLDKNFSIIKSFFTLQKSDRTHVGGFTIVEMIVVMSIFAMMAGLVLFRYRDFGGGINLENTTQEIALEIQKAQNYAVSGRYPSLSTNPFQAPPDANWRPSYGVYFSINSPKQFVFFFDANNGTADNLGQYGDLGRGIFDQASTGSGDGLVNLTCATTNGIGLVAECLDKITIASNETIYDLCHGATCGLSNLSLVFTRPFPDRIAMYSSSYLSHQPVAIDDARVRVKGEALSGCRDIYITPLGQISIKSTACTP